MQNDITDGHLRVNYLSKTTETKNTKLNKINVTWVEKNIT